MKLIESDLLKKLQKKASDSNRKRTHYNLHNDLQDPIQRLCIVMNTGSYIQPHKHTNPDKWELMIALKGSAVVLFFDDEGCVTKRVEISHNGPIHLVEIPEKTWHTLAALEDSTALMEIKAGPYIRPGKDGFASWAPEEGSEDAIMYEKKIRLAKPGFTIES